MYAKSKSVLYYGLSLSFPGCLTTFLSKITIVFICFLQKAKFLGKIWVLQHGKIKVLCPCKHEERMLIVHYAYINKTLQKIFTLQNT